MKMTMCRLQFPLIVLACSVVLSLYAEKQPFERYQSLVDRQMFGPLPPGFDPSKLPSEVKGGNGKKQEVELSKEQEEIRKNVRFSVIDRRPDGAVKVGFTDMSNSNDPRSYFLAVGESANGWTVKTADAETATMTIEKDGVELELTLGGDSAKAAGSAAAQTASAGRNSLFRGSPATLRGRRAERAAEEEKRREEEKARREEENARREQENAQREQEKSEREAYQAEQRNQLRQLQETLEKVRAEREAAAKARESSGDGNNETE